MNKKAKSKSKVDKERSKYLSTDFGEILGDLEPLDLDLEFPSPTQSISLRLPREVLNKIRIMADEQDIPYQSLIKLWLADKVKKAS
jgi:predicted DNA binding CopG/RHH family protein